MKYTLETTAITLKMLLESGILKPDTELTALSNPAAKGVLNKDGSITVYMNGVKKTFPFPSGAARFVEKKSINGWLYWYVNAEGEKQNLGFFREKYIHKLKRPEP